MNVRTLTVLALGAIVAFHLGTVTLAAIPANQFSQAAQPASGYLNPYFTQNWRLFAPNPISSDRTIRFQGSYRGADGALETTDWIDWTAVELDLVHHRLVGGRAGYVTNKMYSPLRANYAALDSSQKSIVDTTGQADPLSWDDLRLLLRGNASPQRVERFLRYDESVAQLATDVLTSRWPDRTWTGVRFATRNQGVVPYDDRHLDQAGREAARPPATIQVGGWRKPTPGSERQRRVIAEFDERHR